MERVISIAGTKVVVLEQHSCNVQPKKYGLTSVSHKFITCDIARRDKIDVIVPIDS